MHELQKIGPELLNEITSDTYIFYDLALAILDFGPRAARPKSRTYMEKMNLFCEQL